MTTKIEWCQETWNPITGCTPVSEGCKNCYAKRMVNRLAGRYGYPKDNPFKVTFHRDRLYKPLKWKKPRKIFVCSMGDLFHQNIKIEVVAAIFGVMAFCQNHIFMVLTKRPNRMEYFFNLHGGNYISNFNWWLNEACMHLPKNITAGIRLRPRPETFPIPNILVGVTIENQKRADERIPILLKIPSYVRFVSVEPMLSYVNLQNYWLPQDCRNSSKITRYPKCMCAHYIACIYSGACGGFQKSAIDWVICGAETGPGKRKMKTEWAIDLKNQCVDAGIPFFFKKDSYGNRELDGRIWEQYPE